jgi:predicted metal-binding protein
MDTRQACPGCSSEQVFKLRHNKLDDDRIEVFISCTKCPYRHVLRISTVHIEKLRRQESDLLLLKREETTVHRRPAARTERMLGEVRKALSEAERNLRA